MPEKIGRFMHTTEVSIEYDVLKENAKIALKNQDLLAKYGISAFNIMGAIGSGKTLLIEKTIQRLGSKYRIGVIAGDVIARIDAARFEKYGIPTVQIRDICMVIVFPVAEVAYSQLYTI